jgi:hypothetical protein
MRFPRAHTRTLSSADLLAKAGGADDAKVRAGQPTPCRVAQLQPALGKGGTGGDVVLSWPAAADAAAPDAEPTPFTCPGPPPPLQADGSYGPSTSGSSITLDDLEDLGVIGSGSSGVAKKVRGCDGVVAAVGMWCWVLDGANNAC